MRIVSYRNDTVDRRSGAPADSGKWWPLGGHTYDVQRMNLQGVPDRIGPYSSSTYRLVSFINTCTAVILCTASVDKIELMIHNRSVHG